MDFSALLDANKQEFFRALDQRKGRKAIIWDPELTARFFMVAGFREIKEHDVLQMFQVREGPIPFVDADHLIFLIRPDCKVLQTIVESLKTQVGGNPSQKIHLLFVPNKSVACEQKLKDAGILQKFDSIENIPIFFYYVEQDVLSMELQSALRDSVFFDVKSYLYMISTGILQLETVFGEIQTMYYKGDDSSCIADLLRRRRKVASDVPPRSSIAAAFLFDRTADLVTPLITQLSYEGLIDEIFGINCTILKLPKEHFIAADSASLPGIQKEKDGNLPNVNESASTPNANSELKQIVLNSNEEVFSELRDLNFSAVGPTLSRIIKQINEIMESRKDMKLVAEIKEFVRRMPELQARRQYTSTHVVISELIKNVTTSVQFVDTIRCEQETLNCIDTDKPLPYIEDAIAQGLPLLKVLRLICLQSLVSDGLKPKVAEEYKRNILQSYGYERLPLLQVLEHVGLFRCQSLAKVPPKFLSSRPNLWISGTYSTLQKTMKLLVDQVNEQVPNDISYVYSGYAPIFVRLIQNWTKLGFSGIADCLKRLPGAYGEVLNEMSKKEQRQNLLKSEPDYKKSTGLSNNSGSSTEKKLVLVVLFGGVTLAEISALRYLSNLEDGQYRYLIVTTSIITGDRLIASLS